MLVSKCIILIKFMFWFGKCFGILMNLLETFMIHLFALISIFCIVVSVGIVLRRLRLCD